METTYLVVLIVTFLGVAALSFGVLLKLFARPR
jgi:hypothetical protein